MRFTLLNDKNGQSSRDESHKVFEQNGHGNPSSGCPEEGERDQITPMIMPTIMHRMEKIQTYMKLDLM